MSVTEKERLVAVTSPADSAILRGRAELARRRRWWLGGAGGVMIVVALLSIAVGSYYIPVPEVLAAIGHRLGLTHAAPVSDAVIWDIRLVRVLLAAAVGAGLAASGTVYQATFRNPLVEPFILGVSAGAALGVGITVVLRIPVPTQISAFIGGVIAVVLTSVLARSRGGTSTIRLVLSGIVVGSFFTALFSLLQYMGTDEQLRYLVFWLLGGFYRSDWHDVAFVVPVCLVGVLAISLLGWKLNLLTLGDDQARALGIHPGRTRALVVSLATVVTAASVSVSGIIAWVGLLVPHAARLIVGSDHRYVVPMSAILGATLMLVCDDLARTLHTGELPIGILTSLLGAPLVAFLVMRTTTKDALR